MENLNTIEQKFSHVVLVWLHGDDGECYGRWILFVFFFTPNDKCAYKNNLLVLQFQKICKLEPVKQVGVN